MATKAYKDIRDDLKSGDIVLFSGKGGVSEWIKWFTRSAWSHVGMVIKSEEIGSVLLWESTTLSDLTDIQTGKAVRGVQLVGMRDRVDTYSGEKIAVRQLSKSLSKEQIATLGSLRSKFAGKPYEESKIELLKAAADMLLPENREDLSSLFCSELVAEAYQRMGLLGEKKPSNEYTPEDFSTQADKPLKLKENFKLGSEILIRA